MFNKEELDNLLVKIGSKIKKQIKIYMIGGCALSFKGLKLATKDIDIIITSKEDFQVFDNSMKENGFESGSDRENDFYATALAVYRKDESRIDVFLKQVGKMLFLSESMIKRAKECKTYGNLIVYLVSNEDIFLFKAMTSREGDVYDCDRLMKEGIDYKIVYNEIVEQSKSGKKWFFWVYESLCRLENYNKIKTLMKNKVFELVNKYWNEKPADFMEDIENLENHIPDKKLLKELNIKT
ncbi:MAG: hypothetical protein Q8N63_05845 [Nanoarchaeota archaeon]|nr:hypothetical protein [Nanoarchaeota archaeon]